MAMIHNGSICPLCKKELGRHSPLFATSGVFFPPGHRLYPYCDAALHWDCYERWPDRIEFTRGYFQMWVEGDKDNPYWGQSVISEEVYVKVNPELGIVAIRFANTGREIRIALKNWNDWIRSSMVSMADLPLTDRDSLSEVWPLLQEALPNAEKLLEGIDWEAKQAVIALMEEKARRSEEMRLAWEKSLEEAWLSFQQYGICPYCQAGDIRHPAGRSYFICNSCGRSFAPDEKG